MDCNASNATARGVRRLLIIKPNQQFLSYLLGFLILFNVCCIPTAMADDGVGLNGLLPRELPEGISTLDLTVLPAEWVPWTAQLQANLALLYGFDNPGLEKQYEILADIQNQLGRLYDDLASQGPLSYQSTLVDLEGKLARRIDLMLSLLRLLESNSDIAAALRPELQKLIEAVENYEADALDGEAGSRFRQQLAVVQSLVTDHTELDQVITVHYYNYNFRTFVSEPFAEYAFNEWRRECGPVCDFILGARVRGNQRTDSGVSLQFIPSTESAKFSIHINGNTVSNTRGVTDQATIYTYGNHRFQGKKVISRRDGSFSWERASLSVYPNNTVTDAKINNRGLLAKLIGDKIAYKRAVEMTGKTESIAASRVRSKVLPKFNDEVEKTFGELNQKNQELRDRMQAEAIAPNETLNRTDADELRTAERLMNPGQLAADRPTTIYNTSTGITVQLHESWINNALARASFPTEKTEMTFPEFGQMLSSKFERAFELDIKREPAEEDGDTVLIYETDPLHVQFDNNKMKVILRIGIRQAGREDVIEHRRIEIPLKLIIEPDTIRVVVAEDEQDKVRVLPLADDKRPIANRIIGNKIRLKIEERLLDKTFDRHLIYQADKKNGKEIPISIDRIELVNGWLIAVIEPTSAEVLKRLKAADSE